MRCAVVIFPTAHRDQFMDYGRALAVGMENQGHNVDLIDGTKDVNVRLSPYEYIAFGVETTNFFRAKIPEGPIAFLKNSGAVNGKRSFAFTVRRGFNPHKVLRKIMKVMEHEGMYLKYSEVIASQEDARMVGEELHIESTVQ